MAKKTKQSNQQTLNNYKRILSQKEIDELIEACRDQKNAIKKIKNKNEEIKPYDLVNSSKIIRQRMPILEIIYERFIRDFRVSLSNSLKKNTTISIISTDILKYGEFINTIPIPTAMSIVRFNTLQGSAIILLESKLIYGMIDTYLGGTDRPFPKIEGKEFTQIELSIFRTVLTMIIKDLEQAWSPIHKVDIQYLRTEINPQFIGITHPSSVVIATTLEVEFESVSGTLLFAIPYPTLQPIKNKLTGLFQSQKSNRSTLKDINPDLVSSFKYKVSKRTPEFNITLEEFSNLKEGDVLPITLEKDLPLITTINNKIIKGENWLWKLSV